MGKAKPIEIPPSMVLPPTTTEQQDLVHASQRKISLMWEATQACIAVMITAAVVYISIFSIDSQVLTNAFFLIVSMYFVRTNHNKVGGVGDRGSTES